MAELSTLARPYAKAAFEHARDKNALGEWSQQIATLAAIAADERMAMVLDNPALTDEQQAEKLSDVAGDSVGTGAKNFIHILAGNKRLALLPEIYRQFELYKANQEKSVDVQVVSAYDLSDEMTARLVEALGRKLEREVKMTTSTDPSLIGGVLIKAGDTVIDGSLRGRLNKLAEAMNS